MCNIRKLEQDRKTDFHNWDIACHTALDKKNRTDLFSGFWTENKSVLFFMFINTLGMQLT